MGKPNNPKAGVLAPDPSSHKEGHLQARLSKLTMVAMSFAILKSVEILKTVEILNLT